MVGGEYAGIEEKNPGIDGIPLCQLLANSGDKTSVIDPDLGGIGDLRKCAGFAIDAQSVIGTISGKQGTHNLTGDQPWSE